MTKRETYKSSKAKTTTPWPWAAVGYVLMALGVWGLGGCWLLLIFLGATFFLHGVYDRVQRARPERDTSEGGTWGDGPRPPKKPTPYLPRRPD